MSRPHVEFVQSQSVAWEVQADGTSLKVLSRDPVMGDHTALRLYPADGQGFMRLPAAGQSLEFYVLDGELTLSGRGLAPHAYGYLPAGSKARPWQSRNAAIVLEILEHRPPAPAGETDPEILLDAASLPWDVSTYDPKLRHMQNARKVLRLGPGDGGRSFLLTGLPHGFPDTPGLPLEKHPHGEEMFMIHGEMKSPQGVMRDGAYFYRPPGIWHGLHVSEFGFLMFLRTPGANRVITQWSEEPHDIFYRPSFQPVLPAEAPASWQVGLPPRPVY